MSDNNKIKSLINKYIRGESNYSELHKAMELFSDPIYDLQLHPELYKLWNNIDENVSGQPILEEPEAILDKIHHLINLTTTEKPKLTIKVKKLLFNVLKIAAILVIGIFTGIIADNFQKSETKFYTSIAPKGSISQMLLPDNTIVYLNSGSELKYSLNNSNKLREVFLAGEAWFHVTKNKKNPFVVHTSAYDIQVLGTQFNVKAYPSENKIVTTTEEGKVKITSSEKVKLDQTRTLIPGQQLVYDLQNRSTSVKEVKTRIFTAWKNNKLIFINMNLEELIVLLERKYGVDIEVTDDLVLDYHYDGIIKNETILEVLNLLEETLPIKYKIEGQKVLIETK
jgi:transmembrane sensor